MTKKIEAEVHKVYATWLHSYLNGDVETYDSYLADDYHFIGSTNNEEFLNRNETTNFFKATADQLAGKCQLKNEKRTLEQFGELVFITHLFDAWFLNGTDWAYYGRFRFTSALQEKKEGWRFIYQHFSTTDSKAEEGETIGFDQISAENLQLREAVKRRTVELEQKNRELEIETALERVRARTMAMQRSDELRDTAMLLFQQVEELEINSFACGFNIWDENKKFATAWMATKDRLQPPFKTNSSEDVYLLFREAEKRGDDLFVIEQEGKELEDHYKYLVSIPEVKALAKAGLSFPTFQIIHCAYFSKGYLMFITHEPVPDAHDIFKRFAKVFEQTYTRFLDLQKAEAQAKETQIELALERVRARTMAMQHSDELQETSFLLDEQVRALGIKTWGCAFNIYGEKESTEWFGNEAGILPTYTVPRAGIFKDYYQKGKKGESLYIQEFSGKACVNHYEYMSSLPVIGDVLKNLKKTNKGFPTYQIDHVVYFKYGYLLFITKEHVPESYDIFKRFAKVFEQTYTRFLDLQKAEAQAKEAQIEAALERVRSRSMAMHDSEELKEVIQVVYDEFVQLKINVEHTGFIIDYTTNDDMHIWLADRHKVPAEISIPYFDSPHWNSFVDAKENGKDFFANLLSFEEKNKFYTDLFELIPGLPEEIKEYYLSCKALAISTVLIDNVGLYIENFTGTVYTDEENKILMRFGKVFQQTYTRFLDLQKAEAQAREGQIELGLERVRARAMAMQQSDELKELIGTVYAELKKLNLSLDRCLIWIMNPEDLSTKLWMAGAEGIPVSFYVPYHKNPPYLAFVKGWKEKNSTWKYDLRGKIKKEWDEFVFSNTDMKHLPEPVKKGMQASEQIIMAGSFQKFGCLQTAGPVPLTEEQYEVLNRFAKVFDSTYTRFNDLQKAEAQAKEAQIEAALERVRSRSMAMHKSDELRESGALLFNEITKLGIESITSGYVLMEVDEKIGWNYMPNPSTGEILPEAIGVYHDKTNIMRSVTKNWKKQKPLFVVEMNEEQTITHQTFIAEQSINFHITAAQLIAISPPKLKLHNFNFKQGYLLIVGGTRLTSEQEEMMLRFTKVFQQTYTRFLDLQKAEAQAKEAKIEMALEKVRSRTMAMQQSDELPEAANNLFLQVQALGIPAWSAGYCIWEDSKKSAWCNMSSEGEIQKGFSLPTIGEGYNFINPIKNGDSFHVDELGGKKLVKHYDFMKTLPIVGEILKDFAKKGIDLPTFQIFHIVYFTHGYLMFITYEPVPNDWDIFKRFGKVFQQTYTRFLDLQNAEAQTRQAQINLAVERVRAKALAMHKSEEIIEVVAKLKDEVMNLDIPDVIAATIFLKEGEDKVRMWDLSTLDLTDNNDYEVPFDITFKIKKTDPHLYVKRVWENTADYFVEIQDKKGLKRIVSWLREHDKSEVADEVEAYTETAKLKQLYHATKKLNNGKLVIDLLDPPSDEMENILTKMGAAFDLAYKRFEDLQKAEAQTREALIEAALEKVRSRSLAMHKPDELQEVVATVAEKLKDLGVIFDAGGVILCTYFPDNKDVVHWIAVDDFSTSGRYLVPYFDNAIFSEAWESKIRGDVYFSKEFPVEAKNHFFEYAFEHSDYKHMPKDYKEFVLKTDQHRLSAAWSKNSAILIPSLTGAIPSESDAEILKRFAKVFEQAYIRFMDLQKAEAQARESLIEASLERVRSRSMAMHKSEEMLAVIEVVAKQLLQLNLKFETVSFGKNNQEGDFKFWIASKGQPEPLLIQVPYLNTRVLNSVQEAQKIGVNFIEDVFTAKENKEWSEHLITFSELKYLPQVAKDFILNAPGFARSSFLLKSIDLYVGNYRAIPFTKEENAIFSRFAHVFEQVYTRFLDLQKAEAQARESVIETGLERVRSRTLAMQNSEELAETSVVVFKQLIALGIEPNRLYIGIITDNSGDIEFWATDEDGSKISSKFTGNKNSNASLQKMYKAWLAKEKSLTIDMQGKELEEYFNYLGNELHVPFKQGLSQKRRVQTMSIFSKGFIGIASPDEQPEDTIKLLERFASVFNLTFTRFNDLKISEAHALKAEQNLIEIKAAKQSAETALTELKSTQSQLVQSEKMASLGELTAGIAHEIQNPLNFVNNFSEVSKELLEEMREEMENGDMEEVKLIMADVIQNLEKINHHGKRADGIVKGMLQHSRSSTGIKEPTNINVLADEYFRLAYHGLRAKDKSFNATLVTDFDESVGKVNVVPQDMGRVILNLITNAFYAINEKSKSAIEGFQPTVTVSSKLTPLLGGVRGGSQGVQIAISDNGNGIPKAIVDKIFQPFFTTKPTGKGTGLGLSMSYDIIKAHEGDLKVDTQEGEGTTFTIKLPNE